MDNSTPLRTHPKKETLDFIRAFARNYRAGKNDELSIDDSEKPVWAFPALC